jgi:hypothetical protein
MLEVLDTLRLVIGVVSAVISAIFLVIFFGDVDQIKPQFMVRYKNALGKTVTILCIIFNSICAAYNNELNIIHNGYAKQNAEIYNTTFNYTEYFPVTIHVAIAVAFLISLLYLFFRIKCQKKNSES